MSAFLDSVKADLLDTRLRLALIILAIALVAAVAYAVLGGGSSSTTASTAPPPIPTGVASIAIQAPTSPKAPVSETTSGSPAPGVGSSRNPFTPLPGSKTASTTAATAAASSSASTASAQATSKSSPSSSSSSSTSSSHGSGGSSTQSQPSTPPKPKPPATVYNVALLFGALPAGTPPQSAQLTPYEDVARLTPLPSSKQPLLVFRGVTTGGHSATFSVVGEVILHGKAICLPSASQCLAIELKPGQSEELEYASATGPVVTYELQLVSISASKASAARAARLFHVESKAGRELLLRTGLSALPGLSYSLQRGVLVGARRHRRGR